MVLNSDGKQAVVRPSDLFFYCPQTNFWHDYYSVVYDRLTLCQTSYYVYGNYYV